MKIVVDYETIKALSVNTRLNILKELKKSDLTLSDLSEKLDLKPSTLKEHLDKLLKAGLIMREETNRKWKYYSLSDKARNIVKPVERNVIFALFASILFVILTSYFYFFPQGVTEKVSAAPRMMAVLAESAPPHAAFHFDARLILLLVSLFVLGFVVGYAFKRWLYEK